MLSIQDLFQKMNANPVFQVATTDGDQPHVRTVLLYRADENGILFHTAAIKDLFHQIQENPKVEFCFNCGEIQIRVTGELDIINDNALKDEIANHPTRTFLKAWRDNELSDFYNGMQVLCMKHGSITTWTMATNFDKKEYITF